MHFKRDRYVCGHQNKHGKKGCAENYCPIEKQLIQVILDDLNQLYFSKVPSASLEKLLDNQVKKTFEEKTANTNSESLHNDLAKLRMRKQKALTMLLDDNIDQDAYDGLVQDLNPKIEALVEKINTIKSNEVTVSVDKDALKAYILQQLDPKQPLTELTPSILVRFIHKITVKADGQLEVHYRTSKPSAFYISTNIKLEVPKTHPNKAYIKKHA